MVPRRAVWWTIHLLGGALATTGLGGCARASTPQPIATLQQALRSADALRVRTGGTFDAVGTVHETLLEVRGADEVQSLVRSIRIDWTQRPGGACQPGWPTLEFRSQGAPVASLGVIGDTMALRWGEDADWGSDLILTPSSARAVSSWLTARGVPGHGDWLAAQGSPRSR